MKPLHSIRWRLQLWHGLLLVTVLSGFGVAVYQLESGRQYRRIDAELQQRIPLLVESQHPVRNSEGQLREFSLPAKNAALFDRPGEGSCYYVVWLRHSEHPATYSATAPHDVPQPKAGDPLTRQRGDLREAFLFPGPGDCVLVGRSIAPERAGLQQLAVWIGGIGTAVLLLGLTGGAWLVGRALRPIRNISTTAAQIATGDLSRRIQVADTESELGQLAGVLNSTFARLEASFAQQAQFTSDAAHELRTPVTVMLMHIENGLASACDNAEHHEAFAAAQRAAQRMRRLIESLLELARFDAGQESFQRAPLDLAATVAECVELVRPMADLRRITIKTDLHPAPCTGDADRLALVVINLLSNAIQHNRDGGEVYVVTSREKDLALLTVGDNGPGIAAAHLPRIFDRFYRASASRTPGSGHSGLGLAIAKAVVQAHGGTIEVTSDLNQGTSFTIRLPESVSAG
jgi:two-component system, OmpR family, sensor kinase